MSVTTQAKTSVFVLPLQTGDAIPADRALTVIAPASTVASVKTDLAAAVAELKRQGTEQFAITNRTWARAQHGFFPKLWSGLQSGDWNSLGALGATSLIGGVLAALAGAMTGVVQHSDTMGWLAFGAVFATFASIAPVSALLVHIGTRKKEIAEARMIEVADLAGPLKRFRVAETVEKLRITEGLDVLRAQLDSQQLLSPEARAQLNAAVSEGRALEATYGPHVQRMNRCALLLAEPIDSSAVDSTRHLLDETPDAERAVLGQALLESVFADRQRVGKIPYDVRNDLHELLTAAATNSTPPRKAD